MLVYCFGLFLLQDMFLSLQGFAFERQNMTFTVPARVANHSGASHIIKTDYCHGYHICPRTFFFGDALRELQKHKLHKLDQIARNIRISLDEV